MEQDTLRQEKGAPRDGNEEVCAIMEQDTLRERDGSGGVLNGLREGRLPVSLEDEARAISALAQAGAMLAPAMAILIADARRRIARRDEWVAWATRFSGLEGDDLHHRRAIGDLLLDLRDIDLALYQRLLACDQQKLLALYRLERKDVRLFLARHPDFQRASRDAVRRAVSEWLGEPPAEKHARSLSAASSRLLADIAGWSDEACAAAVEDTAQAELSAASGARLMAAAAVFHGRRGDLQACLAILRELDETRESLRAIVESIGYSS